MDTLYQGFDVDVDTNSKEDRKQMERHADAVTSSQMPEMHEPTIDLDHEKLDRIKNAMCDIVYTLTDAEEIGGKMVVDPTLAYSVKGVCYGFLSQANYMIKRGSDAIPKLANRLRYEERNFDGTEIADTKLQEATNNLLDAQRQVDNLRKHFLEAAEAYWDEVVGEPHNRASSNDSARSNVTSMAQLEARRILQQMDRKS